MLDPQLPELGRAEYTTWGDIRTVIFGSLCSTALSIWIFGCQSSVFCSVMHLNLRSTVGQSLYMVLPRVKGPLMFLDGAMCGDSDQALLIYPSYAVIVSAQGSFRLQSPAQYLLLTATAEHSPTEQSSSSLSQILLAHSVCVCMCTSVCLMDYMAAETR